MRFASDKLVYVDFNDIIFEDLYIGKDDKSKSYPRFHLTLWNSCHFETAASQTKWPDQSGICEDPQTLLQRNA